MKFLVSVNGHRDESLVIICWFYVDNIFSVISSLWRPLTRLPPKVEVLEPPLSPLHVLPA